MDDNDRDGVRSWEDCDDNDPNNTNNNMDDNDCDGWGPGRIVMIMT